MGLARLAIDTPVKLGLEELEGGYPEGSFPGIINNTIFQYYSMLILAVGVVAMVFVSYVTRQPDYSQITGLTFGTITCTGFTGAAAASTIWYCRPTPHRPRGGRQACLRESWAIDTGHRNTKNC